MMQNQIAFTLILLLTWPIRWLPFRAIHRLGNWLGLAVFYCVPKYRKRTLSNLSLALSLPEKELIETAKKSLQNLAIACLEYAKFASLKKTDQIIQCENPEVAAELMRNGKPVIFFCGHLANWEVLFLDGTQRMPGVAIGRPIKNHLLYNWVLSIREKYGGKIIAPQNGIREGLRALKKGSFLGIVGDQGMPDSGYRSPFLGKSAWTSPIAAILSHRTGSPIIVATTKRVANQYRIHYSDPIWPNREAPLEQEIDRLMRSSLAILEKAILETPEQWLWSHNRWKQQTPGRLKKKFRHESILLILPKEECPIDLTEFRLLYPSEFITVYAPEAIAGSIPISDVEIIPYSDLKECFRSDYRFKLVFNFTANRALDTHFLKLAAHEVITAEELLKGLKGALHAP